MHSQDSFLNLPSHSLAELAGGSAQALKPRAASFNLMVDRLVKALSLLWLTLLPIALIALSGCRFKVPTKAEQAALVEMGAFPGGPPAWMSAAVGPHQRDSSGFIPEFFSPRGETAEQRARLSGIVPAQSTAAKSASPAAVDPLSRIAALCPDVERDVNEAITTIELNDRVNKYVLLTQRCSGSSDLWLWLGKDYLKQNRMAEAGRAFEKVLVIDNNSDEARELLRAVRTRE
jgi:hypothetical protein